MSGTKRLLENIFSLFILQGMNYILPLITFPYLVRALGTEKYGLLTFAAAFIQYFIIVTDYGFNLTATRRIALEQKNPAALSKIFSSVMFIKIILMFICFLLLLGIIAIFPAFRSDSSIFFVTFLALVGNVLFPLWFFQGMEKMKYITALNIIVKSLTTLAIFLFVSEPSDYIVAAFIQSIGFVIIGIVSLWIVLFMFKVKPTTSLNWVDIGKDIKEGANVFVATLSGNVYGQGALIFVNLLLGNAAGGVYSIVQKIVSAIVGLVQPIAQAMYPYLCNMYLSNISLYQKLRRNIIIYGFITSIAIGVALCLFAENVIEVVAGSSSSTDLILLIQISAITIALTMNNVLLNGFILSMKKYAEMQRMYLIIAVIFVIISIPLTLWFNVFGMVYSIIFVELYITIKSIGITRDVTKSGETKNFGTN